jgi:hypothetical protein
VEHDLVDVLARDAERAAMQVVLAAFRARYAGESPYVLMCGCPDWFTCAHPWPVILHPVPLELLTSEP